MKYQNFAIIFVLLIIPISIVLSNYIQTQTDTLVLKTSYQTKLNDSTYDAIAAYQMNSLNTQSVTGESVKSYVLASVNTFFTTLATNMGMSSASKNSLLPYIPAILFTTYDGYYIYSPTKSFQIATIPAARSNSNDNAEILDGKSAGQPIMTEDKRIIYFAAGYSRCVRGISGSNKNNGTVDYDGLKNYLEGNELPNDNILRTYGVTLSPNANTTGTNPADVDYNYMLKPFIYYSANYKNNNNYNFVASYTLDNYITLYGRKSTGRDSDKGIDNYTDEFTKSGYLINTDDIELSGDLLVKAVKRNVTYTTATGQKYSGATTDKYEELFMPENEKAKENTIYLKYSILDDKTYNLINYYQSYEDTNMGNDYYLSARNYDPNETEHNTTTEPNKRFQTGDQIIEDTIHIQDDLLNPNNPLTEYTAAIEGSTFTRLNVKYKGIEINDPDAKEYYIKAYFFSEWVQRNLSDVQAKNVEMNIESQELQKNNFAYITNFGDEQIFNIKGNSENNPEDEDSWIAQHKRAIIKNSIQYNLNTAMSTYNTNHFANVETEYRLPVMTNDDWENILNNVCMVSFMQGIPCGATTFNNYAVVKSSNNNTAVNIENMYFTQKIGNERNSIDSSGKIQTSQGDDYHKIDCEKLGTNGIPNTPYEADQSSEFKYDAKKINTRISQNSMNDNAQECIICFYDDTNNTYYEALPTDETNRTSENLYIGNEITKDDNYIINGEEYSLEKLSKLPTGSDVKYLYDHKNEGCYECIIGGNYTPIVKYYKGDLLPTYSTTSGELIMYDGTKWLYEDGQIYDKSRIGNEEAPSNPYNQISLDELNKRRKAVFTYIAKIRNNLYKTNSHVNR